MNHKRVERIWIQEGLKVPNKQPKRGRLWLTDGSCIRLRPLYRHHVWAYDFVADRTHDGRPLKMLTVLDEYSRECLAIVVTRRLQADDVLQTLSELFAEHGPPANLRSDNGPEFTARVVRQWLGELGVKTLFIEPGSPWENGYNESFNGTLRNELLKREIFWTTLGPPHLPLPRHRQHQELECQSDSQRHRRCPRRPDGRGHLAMGQGPHVLHDVILGTQDWTNPVARVVDPKLHRPGLRRRTQSLCLGQLLRGAEAQQQSVSPLCGVS